MEKYQSSNFITQGFNANRLLVSFQH